MVEHAVLFTVSLPLMLVVEQIVCWCSELRDATNRPNDLVAFLTSL